MYNLGQIMGFCPKVATPGPHFHKRNTLFMNVMQLTRAGFTVWHSARSSALSWLRLLLVLTYVWQEDVAKTPKVPGAL